MKTALFLAPSAYTLGGIQTWLDYILPGLNNKGWRSVLGLPIGKFHDVGLYQETHPYDDIITFTNPTGSREGRVNALIAAIRKIKPDVVIVLNIVDAYEAVERIKLTDDWQPKIIATLHGIQFDFLQDYSAYARTIDAVICTNRLAQHLVQVETGLDKKRVLYAPYGVEIHVNSVLTENTQEKGIRIAYVGRLEEPQKRVSDIPLILDELSKNNRIFDFVVAGGGPEEEKFKKEMQKRNLDVCVKYLGVLDSEKLTKEVYEVADVLILTSSWETGPIVAWEAMAHDIVLVTSKYLGSGMEGSLINGKNCLMFEPGNIQEAVDCLIQVYDITTRKTLAEEGKKLVQNKYSINASINAWNDCLETVRQLSFVNPDKQTIYGGRGRSRLDKIFGYSAAEFIRKLIQKKFDHMDTGGEWPHSYGISHPDERKFIEMVKKIENSY